MSKLVDGLGSYIDAQSVSHPGRARALLLAAWRAKRIQLRRFPEKALPPSKQELARILMDSMIGALAEPENAAMVSLFVPCEMLHALGIRPYSVEGLSSYITATSAHRAFLDRTGSDGVPETLCSYHRVYLGAAEMGVMSRPAFILHTSLACDANQITFQHLSRTFGIPDFAVDVPYEASEDAVEYVAGQLREMKIFIEDCAQKKLPEEALREAVARTGRTGENYLRYLALQKDHYLATDVTSELYAACANHVLLGSEQTERFSRLCLQDMQSAPANTGLKLLWLHTNPFWQTPVRQRLNHNPAVRIAACDMSYEALSPVDPEKPYESMASRLVYSPFNGGAERRIQRALEIADLIGADGVVYFCHWGCKATLGAAQLVKHAMEDAGYPTLILDGDGCDPQNSSDGQVSTRLDAFLELLEAEKS